MKKASVSQLKEDLNRYLTQAKKEQVIITRNGQPVGVLIGFASDEDWFDYFVENHPAVLKRVARARADLKAGRGIRLEDFDWRIEGDSKSK